MCCVTLCIVDIRVSFEVLDRDLSTAKIAPPVRLGDSVYNKSLQEFSVIFWSEFQYIELLKQK